MAEHFSYLFRVFSIIGVHPLHNLHKPMILFNAIALIFMYALVLIKLFVEINSESIESFSILSQVSIKYAVLIFKRDAIRQAVRDVERFWKHDLNDPKINALMKYLVTGAKIYTITVCILFIEFVSKPFISRESSVLGCYIPLQIPYPLFYLIEFHVVGVAAITYMAFNLLIYSTIILVVVQFRQLNNQIKSLNLHSATESDQNLKICLSRLKVQVEYHNFLIKFTENLNKILSLPFLLLIIISISMMCINAYVLSQNNLNKVDCFRNVLTSCALMCEFFFLYGLPAQLLMEEAENIGNTAYCECEWYLPNIIPVRKYLLMMMIRSQRPVRLSAENFIDINNRTILLMLKTTYSFYTFFETIT